MQTFIPTCFSSVIGHIDGLANECLIYVDVQQPVPPIIQCFYIQMEPEVIKSNERFLLENGHQYTGILTYLPSILNKFPEKSYLYYYGTTWIDKLDYENIDISKKEFSISMFTGAKSYAPGHIIRQHFHHSQSILNSKSSVPITFFRSSLQTPLLTDYGNNPLIGKSKFPLFEHFQYALIVENSRQLNYFTEKLIDCLITKTVPIYYGCPNIADIFDTTGWIIFTDDNIPALIEKINSKLAPDHYMKCILVIEDNYQRAIKYSNIKKNLERNIKKEKI